MSIHPIRLKVTGEHTIHCGGCANTIKLVLKRLPGVLRVEASPHTQLVEVMLNGDQTRVAVIQDALAAIGYETVETDARQS